jgi:preprotein translocase subunit SecA
MVTRSIESAQRKVEARNFDMRKQLLEYDDVSNDQRKVIYEQRNAILDADDLNAEVASLREGAITDLVRQYVPHESVEEQWDLPGLQRALQADWQISLDLVAAVADSQSMTDEDILKNVMEVANALFAGKVEQIGAENFTRFERMVLLQTIDTHWRDHLSALDYLRQGIHLRGYAQKQPKQEYKREAFELFGQMLDAVKNAVTSTLMTVRIQTREELDAAAQEMEAKAENISNITYTAPTGSGEPEVVAQEAPPFALAGSAGGPNFAGVGRNEACPCGSGKKFKHCHGKLS